MMVSFDGLPAVILDIEASALERGSYPIEIGLVRDVTGPAEAFLIRPTSSWSKAGIWSPESAKIHGINTQQLETEGVDVADACARIDSLVAGGVLVSDAPHLDAYWLGELYGAAGLPTRHVVGMGQLIDQLPAAGQLTTYEVEMLVLDVEIAYPQIHRAGPDAEALAALVRAVIDPAFRATIPVE